MNQSAARSARRSRAALAGRTVAARQRDHIRRAVRSPTGARSEAAAFQQRAQALDHVARPLIVLADVNHNGTQFIEVRRVAVPGTVRPPRHCAGLRQAVGSTRVRAPMRAAPSSRRDWRGPADCADVAVRRGSASCGYVEYHAAQEHRLATAITFDVCPRDAIQRTCHLQVSDRGIPRFITARGRQRMLDAR